MLNVTKELTALARKLGYEGKAPDTVARAINAITSVAGEGGDGCDCEPGYRMVETQLFSETVTTTDNGYDQAPVGVLAYNSPITAPTISVTFDNSTYTLPLNVQPAPGGGEMYIYGEAGELGPSFSTYPLCIGSMQNPENPDEIVNVIYTETEGTYNLSASASVLETSEDFDKAVAKASSSLILTKEAYNSEIHDTLIGEELLNLVEEDVFGNGNISHVLVGATSQEILNAFPNVVCKETSNGSTTIISLSDIRYAPSPSGNIYRIEVGTHNDEYQEFFGLPNSIMITINDK